MRFLKAILWLMIVLVPFSGLLYSLTYLELEIIGEGSPIANVSYYILTQDENNPIFTDDLLRRNIAKLFLEEGAANLLVYVSVFWLLISILWIIIGEVLRIDRPGQAIKYIWIWFVLLVISLVVVASMTWYFLYAQDVLYQRAEFSSVFSLLIFMLIYTAVYFYLSCVFITSRVIRSAVPFLTIILRN